MKSKKKTSADYGQFYFRVPLTDKPNIEAEIQSVLAKLSKKYKSDDLKPKRNELILRALRRGLKVIENEL